MVGVAVAVIIGAGGIGIWIVGGAGIASASLEALVHCLSPPARSSTAPELAYGVTVFA